MVLLAGRPVRLEEKLDPTVGLPVLTVPVALAVVTPEVFALHTTPVVVTDAAPPVAIKLLDIVAVLAAMVPAVPLVAAASVVNVWSVPYAVPACVVA
jgi:hypothetical protein